LANCRFSRRAEDDLLGIAAYTLRTWGENQAIRYIAELEACCQMLADNPALGRSCEDIRVGLRRMETRRHVVFYREKTGAILIS
jgi:toxin ParE1/3/4